MRGRPVGYLAFVTAAAMLAMAAPPALAQKITGDITGTVTDATGGAMPGAPVTAVCEATGLTRTAVTDATGGYRPAGAAAVRLQGLDRRPGLQDHVSRSVQLAVNNLVKADFRLQLGQTSRRR